MDKNWHPKPWIAATLGLFLQSFSFLYVNQGTWFFVYLALTAVAAYADWRYGIFSGLVVSIACAIHAYTAARRYASGRVRRWYSRPWAIPVILLGVFGAIFSFRTFCYEPYYFPSSSMNPTIYRGNYIFIKKLGFHAYSAFGVRIHSGDISDPSLMKRGAIYAFYPPHKSEPYVKRLIGVPGDKVYVGNGDVYVNGRKLESTLEANVGSSTIYQEVLNGERYFVQYVGSKRRLPPSEHVVPANSYFFLGDNRDNSSDSRVWGVVKSSSIIGEVVYIVK